MFYVKILGIVYRASKLAQKGRYDNQCWIESSLTTVRARESVGGRLEVRGLENVQRLQSPAVFIGNHMSILETIILPCLIQPYRDVTFVVKESLIAYPFFGHVMRNRKPVVVGRESPREDLKLVLEEGRQRLEANVSVVIFPQTSRSARFDPSKFNTLGIKLAKRCNVYRREINPVNFAPRVTVPTLILTGKNDFVRPIATRQEPLLRLLGTPDDQKKIAAFDGGHVPSDMTSVAKEALAWLDRFFGPVEAAPR